jgi:hypothetical protein
VLAAITTVLGLGKRLQTDRNLHGFAQQTALIRAVADDIAAYDRPSGDTDAQLQWHGATRIKPGDSLDQGEAGTDGFLGVKFVCLRISETGQQFIPREPLDHAAIP